MENMKDMDITEDIMEDITEDIMEGIMVDGLESIAKKIRIKEDRENYVGFLEDNHKSISNL